MDFGPLFLERYHVLSRLMLLITFSNAVALNHKSEQSYMSFNMLYRQAAYRKFHLCPFSEPCFDSVHLQHIDKIWIIVIFRKHETSNNWIHVFLECTKEKGSSTSRIWSQTGSCSFKKRRENRSEFLFLISFFTSKFRKFFFILCASQRGFSVPRNLLQQMTIV